MNEQNQRQIKIGELAEQAGVSHRTIHYYEKIGLMQPSKREGMGYRYYDEEALQRLWLIKRLKQLGLSLDEIKSVIDLYFEEPTGIKGKQKVLKLLQAHLEETNIKLKELNRFRDELLTNIVRIELYIEEATKNN